MEPGKLVSRSEADGRLREDIFVSVIGGGMGVNGYAIGTPEGVRVGCAIELLTQKEH